MSWGDWRYETRLVGVSLILNWRKAVATVCVALAMSAVGMQAHALTVQVGHDFTPSHTHEAAEHHDHHDEAPAVADLVDGAQLAEAPGPDLPPAAPAPAGHHHHSDTVSGLAATTLGVGSPTSVSPARLTLSASDDPLGWLPTGPDEPPRPFTHSA